MTVRDINDIRGDWKKHEKYMVDGTGWDEDDEPANAPEPAKSSKTVKFDITPPATSQITSATPTSKSGVIAPTIRAQPEPVSTAEQQKCAVSPRPLECDGCGESDVAYQVIAPIVQCNICKTWSHTDCFADSIELSMGNGDGTWSCPTCRDIVVWTDKK